MGVKDCLVTFGLYIMGKTPNTQCERARSAASDSRGTNRLRTTTSFSITVERAEYDEECQSEIEDLGIELKVWCGVRKYDRSARVSVPAWCSESGQGRTDTP